MAPHFPSIQSFFQTKSSPNSKDQPSSSATIAGDGFSAAEVNAVLHPSTDSSWTPTQDYEERDIGALDPGPKCVTFMGRIVNFYDQAAPSKKPRAARGCIKLILADGTGALTVSLISIRWYRHMAVLLTRSVCPGQTMVRQHGIQIPPRPSYQRLDTPHLSWRDRCSGPVKRSSFHEYLPRERPQLPPHDP